MRVFLLRMVAAKNSRNRRAACSPAAAMVAGTAMPRGILMAGWSGRIGTIWFMRAEPSSLTKSVACNKSQASSPKEREPRLASPVSNSRHHKTRRDQMLDTPEINRDQTEAAAPSWAADAPRGGKTVMNRILKENATVPLFFAQTLIASLRDVGL